MYLQVCACGCVQSHTYVHAKTAADEVNNGWRYKQEGGKLFSSPSVHAFVSCRFCASRDAPYRQMGNYQAGDYRVLATVRNTNASVSRTDYCHRGVGEVECGWARIKLMSCSLCIMNLKRMWLGGTSRLQQHLMQDALEVWAGHFIPGSSESKPMFLGKISFMRVGVHHRCQKTEKYKEAHDSNCRFDQLTIVWLCVCVCVWEERERVWGREKEGDSGCSWTSMHQWELAAASYISHGCVRTSVWVWQHQTPYTVGYITPVSLTHCIQSTWHTYMCIHLEACSVES